MRVLNRRSSTRIHCANTPSHASATPKVGVCLLALTAELSEKNFSREFRQAARGKWGAHLAPAAFGLRRAGEGSYYCREWQKQQPALFLLLQGTGLSRFCCFTDSGVLHMTQHLVRHAEDALRCNLVGCDSEPRRQARSENEKQQKKTDRQVDRPTGRPTDG